MQITNKVKNLILILLFSLSLSFLSFGNSKTEVLKDSLSYFEGLEKAQMLFSIGNLYYPNNNDSAMHYIELAMAEYQNENYEKGIASCYGIMGAIYGDCGMYDTAISLIYKLAYWGEENKDVRAFIAYLELANIYHSMGESAKAKDFYKKAISGSYPPAKRAAFANMGLIYLKSESYDTAAYYFTGGLKEYFKTDTSLQINKFNIASLYLNLASVDYGKGEYKQGIKILNESLLIFKEIDNKASVTNVFLKLGEGYEYLHRYDISLDYYLKAKLIADSLQIDPSRKDVYFKLFKYYQKQSEFEDALFYHIKFDDVRDSLVIQTYKNTIVEIEVKYEVHEKLNKIVALEKEKQKVYSYAIIIILSLLLISAIIILLINNKRLKHKSAKALADAKSQFAEKRASLSEQKLDKITSSLHKKSAFIERLEEEIRNLGDKQDQDKMAEKVQLLRETRILTDGDWQDYNKVFYELHPGFKNSIEGLGDLSVGDKRQLIFIKLGLKQKEIAHLMGISPEGAKKARQRLSKKVGLDSAGNLNKFVEDLC